MKKIIRPPAIEDGEYWIGKFLVKVENDIISISPRHLWSHNHQRVDTIFIEHLHQDYCILRLKHQKDSKEAEHRISKLISSKEWKPRAFKYR